ncbi:MAG: exodeoxyribonuclease VII large subunit [Candidatus Kapabacteria bacterium]|nr:exodeoxyribonuclease VII large subunit [Candidatus Kapabacteria bacterium]
MPIDPTGIESVSVSELTHAIRALLTEGIGDVIVQGEISNFKAHSSGHRYFTLKDADAQIACVMWRTRSLAIVPQDGMQVILGARLTVYPPQGKYQLDVTWVRAYGVGALQRVLEERKRLFAARGWFDWQRKRPLPELPMVIGVVTSPTGAALQDILRTVGLRFPAARIIVRPALVQGQGAAEDVAAAIEELQDSEADVLIVGRGGGSIEDLWAFNEEVVAEAIINSAIPVISAVGHETDETISDLVADMRAATPTHAAVLATPVTVDDLVFGIDDARMRMTRSVARRIDELRQLAGRFTDGSTLRRLQERLLQRQQRIDELSSRYHRSIHTTIDRLLRRVDHQSALLTTLHPLAPLRRGFAVVERQGVVLAPADELRDGELVTVRRYLQTAQVTVTATQSLAQPEGPSDEETGS